MLICPDCKFENSNSNKFCQNCGTSLIYRECLECSAHVPTNAHWCPNCGAKCGTVRLAIVIYEGALDQENVRLRGENSTLSPVFLDPQQRYQLLESLPNNEIIAPVTEVQVRVLDCQPYRLSPIGAILTNSANDQSIASIGTNDIPPLAKTYIELQSGAHAGIPLIYDAWVQDNVQVIILEDRSEWHSLLDVWQEDTTSLLQILSWCYQMTQLWAALEPVNCRQSLLELSNLRLDEDETLAIQQLYSESSSDNSANTTANTTELLTLQVLGQIWQMLFRQSQRTQFGSIIHMLEDLEFGKIDTITQLRSRLEEIAAELGISNSSDLHPENEESTEGSTSRNFKSPIPSPEELEVEEWENTYAKNDDAPTMILAMQLGSLEDVGRTDVGRQRDRNEDFFGIETNVIKQELSRSRIVQARGVYILCDGMGGHAGGEVASALAVTTLRDYFQKHWLTNELPSEQTIREAVYLANQTIYDLNQREGRAGAGRMGTTLVLLLLQDTRIAFAHVGDSRLYRLTRKAGLQQLTIDHEVGQREICKGVSPSIAYSRPDAYQLTQALGPRDEYALSPDVEFLDIYEDTLLLLVSDGLSDNNLLENNCQSHLESLLSSSANLEQGVSNLIDLANQYNGHDNITAIAVRIKVRPAQEVG